MADKSKEIARKLTQNMLAEFNSMLCLITGKEEEKPREFHACEEYEKSSPDEKREILRKIQWIIMRQSAHLKVILDEKKITEPESLSDNEKIALLHLIDNEMKLEAIEESIMDGSISGDNVLILNGTSIRFVTIFCKDPEAQKKRFWGYIEAAIKEAGLTLDEIRSSSMIEMLIIRILRKTSQFYLSHKLNRIL